MFKSALIAFLLASSALAQVPGSVVVDLARPSSLSFSLWQGETLNIDVSYKNAGSYADLSGVTSATLYWQTNGMTSAWWQKPAEIVPGSPDRIRATFHPTNDCGAACYTFFLRAQSAEGGHYRANGRIIMNTSPGYQPNTLAPPVRAIDFDLLNVLNPPWPSVSALNSVSNTLASGITAATANISALAGSHVLLQSLVTTNTTAISGINAALGTQANDINLLRSHADTNTAAIAALNTYNTTSRVDRLWTNATNYLDGAGNFYSIEPTYGWTLTVADLTPAAPGNDPSSLAAGTYPLPGLTGHPPAETSIEIQDQLGYTWYIDVGTFGSDISITLSSAYGGYIFQQAAPPATTVYNLDAIMGAGTPIVRHEPVATTPVLIDTIVRASAQTLLADCLLYSSGGTNYYFRWNTEAETYVVTGVAQ